MQDILQQTHVCANDTLYVGASGVDMQTAHNAHVTACGVTWGFRPRQELLMLNPSYIVDRPQEIVEIVLGK